VKYASFPNFSQFSINYANEKLQDHFNFSIFKSQQELYLAEGIIWKVETYPDATERIDLFENKTIGLFSLCDEMLKLSSPNEAKLITSYYLKNYKTNKYFGGNKLLEKSCEFIICHYACDVVYNVTGWIEKNKSDVALEIKNCIYASSNLILGNSSSDNSFPNSSTLSMDVVNQTHSPRRKSLSITGRIKINSAEQRSLSLASEDSKQTTNATQYKSFMMVRKKINTILSQFSKDLNDLMVKIKSMRSHFIRCIKPNASLSPGIFTSEMILLQLRCGGTLQAIQVYHDGFPHRMNFQYFLTRYSAFVCLCGINSVTRDVKDCITRAQLTGRSFFWRIAALKLIDVIRFTTKLLEEFENASPKFLVPVEDTELLQGLQIGKTAVFLRTNVFEYLESTYLYCVTMIAKKLQRRWRAYKYLQSASPIHNGTQSHISLTDSLLSFSESRLKKLKLSLSATVIIQRRCRVYLAIQHRKHTLSGIVRYQALYRGHATRREIATTRRQCATLIQSITRGYCARIRFRKCLSSIVLIQYQIRRFIFRCWKDRSICAALLIQKFERGRQCRNRMRAFLCEQVYRTLFPQTHLSLQYRAKIEERHRISVGFCFAILHPCRTF
jgi:myosin-5